MKRMLAVLLVLLLLTGCNLVEPGGTEPSGETVPTIAPTEPGIYDGASEVEAATDGAVRCYRIEDGCRAVAVVGENVILFYDTFLRAYTGDELHPVREWAVDTVKSPRSADVQITAGALSFYDEANHAMVMLNSSLKEIARVSLPKDVQGEFVLTDTLDALYYCTADAIRCYNLKTGTSRLLRQQNYDSQTLTQNGFGGDILGCQIQVNDRKYMAYISAETGELLGRSERAEALCTGGDYYFLPVEDEGSIDYLFGTVGESPRSLYLDGSKSVIHTALAMGGVFTETSQDSGLVLDYYDLSSGKRTASVTLPDGGSKIAESWPDGENNCLWLLMEDPSGGNCLYRWDLKQSPVVDSEVYTGQWFTAEHPDKAGLQQCDADAQALGQKFGVTISIGQVPEGCPEQIIGEYRVSRIQSGLTALERALERYPQGMLETLGSVSRSGKLHLILVRDIAGGHSVVQYWSGSNACVVLELGENLTAAVDNGVYHVMDTYLFNHTSTLDQWAELNPKGFRYDMNASEYLQRQEDTYLTGDKRSFVDSRSMSYPLEDRAAVFTAAMGEGNQDVFASRTMQQKLLTLCQAIRDAFEWKKSQEAYLWEQYLAESVAYQPKK